MESIQIYLNSKTADKFNSNSIADAEYILPMIEIGDGFHIYISLQKASIPNTFYNINSSNNILDITTDILLRETIPEGNYNINQLISYLKSILPTFTIDYNVINNKCSFSYTSAWIIMSSSTLLSVLGFNESSETQSVSNGLGSYQIQPPHCCNLVTVKTINIVTNLSTNNINKAIPHNNSILCSIPVNVSPYSMIQYENNNNFRTNLFVNSLCMLNIKLVDDLGNIINLNGAHYSMTFQIDIIKFR